VYPKLFSFTIPGVGEVPLYSFGAMLGLGFLVANYLLSKEIARKKIVPDVASTVTLISISFGIFGSKLFHVLENFGAFLHDPFGVALNAGGLTFYGGLICAVAANIYYLRSENIPVLKFFDAAAPSIMIAYGIGRIGCLLAGDGCYGEPTKVAWAMTYPKGFISTLASQNPELAAQYRELFPGEVVPIDIPVHPTPIYEFLYALVIFAILWKLRLQPRAFGWLFFVYLALQSVGRFVVEFIRLNPPVLLGLSEAQLIAVVMFIVGAGMVVYLWNKPPPPEPAPSTLSTKKTTKKQPVFK
jgi:phosphatidylglycerol---prolipoprotein diacylglyceryl transferase